jgi:hypothetical protein
MCHFCCATLLFHCVIAAHLAQFAMTPANLNIRFSLCFLAFLEFLPGGTLVAKRIPNGSIGGPERRTILWQKF